MNPRVSTAEGVVWLTVSIAVVALLYWKPPTAGAMHPDWVALRKSDPAFGSSIPVKGVKGPVLLILAGDCMSCTMKSFNPRELQAPRGIKKVLLVRHGDTPAPAQTVGLDLVLAIDVRTEASLNPIWTPRWYLYSVAGTLEAIQLEPQAWKVSL